MYVLADVGTVQNDHLERHYLSLQLNFTQMDNEIRKAHLPLKSAYITGFNKLM
jgi:hypothetical protein